MTTEEDWTIQINVTPDDFYLLAVYSDWVREQGDDLLADGWWAISIQQRRPHYWGWDSVWGWIRRSGWKDLSSHRYNNYGYCFVDDDWYDLMPRYQDTDNTDFALDHQKPFDAFRELATAYTKLPADRREALLVMPTYIQLSWSV